MMKQSPTVATKTTSGSGANKFNIFTLSGVARPVLLSYPIQTWSNSATYLAVRINDSATKPTLANAHFLLSISDAITYAQLSDVVDLSFGGAVGVSVVTVAGVVESTGANVDITPDDMQVTGFLS